MVTTSSGIIFRHVFTCRARIGGRVALVTRTLDLHHPPPGVGTVLHGLMGAGVPLVADSVELQYADARSRFSLAHIRLRAVDLVEIPLGWAEVEPEAPPPRHPLLAECPIRRLLTPDLGGEA